MKLPLPCIVCGFEPDPVERDRDGAYQPYEATMFSAGAGHYGSTVWDEMSNYRSLEVNICDKCLITHKNRIAVCTTISRPEITFEPWEPGDGDD